MDDARILATTGRDTAGWVTLLDGRGCRELPHTEIARLVPALLPEPVENKGWWAQAVTVEYEKAIGRRVVGQTCEGDFSVSVSKTFPGSRDEALAAWLEVVQGMAVFDGVAVQQEAVTSRTEKWSRWRVALADGSRVVAECYDKQATSKASSTPTSGDATRPAKAAFSVTHQKLASADQVERWRAVWKPLLGRMGQ